ncbi:MAG: histidine phosphatase family protein [Candidatus Peribacteria bacterium]|nr:histidine phosphatase family protein [Candidatus Peribacteria bacterium]
MIGEHPELFPDLIYVSPYLRTRLTANYLLKDIKGLDINFDHLTDEEQLQDLILGSFNGRDITIKIEERIRERDHGGNIAPNYVRDYLEGKKNATHLLSKTQKNKLHYYTAPEGGESQVEVNARTREFLSKIYQKEEYKNILIVSHHLTIISALMSIFGGSFNSFTDIDENRRPRNGSFTFLSEIPKTEMGRENKFRVSGYNLSLEE